MTRDYPRLVAAAAHVVAPDGVLLAATNHAQTADARFDDLAGRGPLRSRRAADVSVGRWHEPSTDFPVARGARPYLKVRALQLN